MCRFIPLFLFNFRAFSLSFFFASNYNKKYSTSAKL
jgi:hypothetical protein